MLEAQMEKTDAVSALKSGAVYSSVTYYGEESEF